MKLFGERAFVKPDVKTKTEGGFSIPQEEHDKGGTGTVEAVGIDLADIKVGDRIIYDRFQIIEMTVEGVKRYVIEGEDIVGKL